MKRTTSVFVLLLFLFILVYAPLGCTQTSSNHNGIVPDGSINSDYNKRDAGTVGTNAPHEKPADTEYTFTKGAVYGNTSGNIFNYGLTSTDGQWIVYANGSDEGGPSDRKLYRTDMQGNGTIKLSDDRAWFVNLIDGCIYYSNVSDNRTVYKMNLDGTQRMRLNDHRSDNVYVVDDWIYYRNGSTLYKMKIDGSELTEIVDEAGLYFSVYKDWVYYREQERIIYNEVGEAKYRHTLHRIKTDGSGKELVFQEDIHGFLIEEEWVYVCLADDQKIYRMTLEGEDITKIVDYYTVYFNISDGWVYGWIIDSDRNYFARISTDGSQKELLDECRAAAINIVGEWIYYDYIFAEHSEQYKMKLDGSDNQFVDMDDLPSEETLMTPFIPEIEQIEALFSLTKEEVIAILGDDYEIVLAGPEHDRNGYYFKEFGMTIIFEKDYYSQKDIEIIISIYCDDTINVNGARLGMTFDEIFKVLPGGIVRYWSYDYGYQFAPKFVLIHEMHLASAIFGVVRLCDPSSYLEIRRRF